MLELLSQSVDWQALGVSLKLAFATAVVLFIIGVPIAYWAAYSTSRLRPIVESFLSLPFVLPPTVLGFYLLLLFVPAQLAFTFTSVLVGSVLLNLPIAVQAFAESFRAVDSKLIEASASLASPARQTFFRLILPLSWPGIASGLALAFAHALGEFGVAMMVGGNLKGETRTLSISVYDNVQTLDMNLAHATAFVQVMIGLILLGSIAILRARLRKQMIVALA